MSIEHLAIVLNHSTAKGTARIVLMGLANHANITNNRCWPSITRLQRYTGGMDRTSIMRALDRLEQLGEISRIRHGGPAPEYKPDTPQRHRPNLYEILLRCPETCDATPQHRDRRRPLVPDEMLGDIDESEVANNDLEYKRGRKNDDYEVAPMRPKPLITNNTKKVLNLTIEGTQKTYVYDPLVESRLARARAIENPPIECEHKRVAIVCPICRESTKDKN